MSLLLRARGRFCALLFRVLHPALYCCARRCRLALRSAGPSRNTGYSSVGRASDCRCLQQSDGPIPGGRRLRLVGLHIYLLRWNPAAGLVGSGARKVGHRVPHVPLATRNGELACVAGLRCGFAPPVLPPPAKTNRRHAICNCGDGAVVSCSRRRFTRLANLISANSRLRWRACQAPLQAIAEQPVATPVWPNE